MDARLGRRAGCRGEQRALRQQGVGMLESIIRAGVLRFRPVLMTAFSTILGTLPIALATGAGAESRRPMGTVVIGGMLLSTILTLVVIPVVHIMVQKGVGLLRDRLRPEA